MATIKRLGPRGRLPTAHDCITVQHRFTTGADVWDVAWCFQSDTKEATWGQLPTSLASEAAALEAAAEVSRLRGISAIYILP